MEAAFIFLLKVSGCLAIFYGVYLLIFRNDTNFKIQRFYLLASVGLSIIMPFNNYALRQYKSVPAQKSISAPAIELQNQETANQKWANQELKTSLPNNFSDQEKSTFSLTALLKWLYISIAALLLFRIISGLLKFGTLRIHSRCDEIFHTRVYLTDKINGSANIFGFIFLKPSLTNDPKLSQIILHEKIHASQYHSIDILLAELLAAATWFNPVVWFMRRSLQQIHEYLADDGVINSGFDKLEYQKLLVNQIAEENLLLSSGFQSSIKKRMIMMTKHKTSRGTKRKFLTILPIAAGILVAISCMNSPKAVETPVKAITKDSVYTKIEEKPTNITTLKDSTGKIAEKAGKKEEHIAVISPTAMNVLYLGVDNPVDIAVSGISMDKIRPSITNGSIFKTGHNYVVRPKTLGNTIIHVEASIDSKWKTMGYMEFRVKRVPDPVAMIGDKKGGLVQKDFLTSQNELQVLMENFDFKLVFKVKEFKLSTVSGGYNTDIVSKSNKITGEQKNLISQALSGQKIYFIDIKCVGPDGSVRELPPMLFEIL